MPEQDYKYSVPFKVRSYEVDYQQEATLSTICDYFQEAAGLHAQQLRFDISDLQEKGFTWILYKLQVKVYEFPKRWETIEVVTWPSTGDGIRAYRDYELYGEKGTLLAAGLSQWMILDLQKNRPVRIPDELMNQQFKTDQHVLNLHKKKLQRIEGKNAELITTASLNDLDMNRHVNNVRYIDWITGYNLNNQLKGKKCSEIVIQFTAETKAGEKIYLSCKTLGTNKNEIAFSLFKNQTDTVIANASAVWK